MPKRKNKKNRRTYSTETVKKVNAISTDRYRDHLSKISLATGDLQIRMLQMVNQLQQSRQRNSEMKLQIDAMIDKMQKSW